MKDKKTYIMIIVFILVVSVVLSIIFYNKSGAKIIKEYDQLISNMDGINQVRSGKDYFLLDNNFKQIDSSKIEFKVLYGNYYLKGIDKNYYLIRNKNQITSFDGNPMMSNMLRVYKDDKDKNSKYLYLDGVKLFDDTYNCDYDISNYYITKIGNKYLIYDVNTGKVLLTVDSVNLLILDKKYYGINVSNDGINSIYLLDDKMEKLISLNSLKLNQSKYFEEVSESGFNLIEIQSDKYFIAINSNNKYGLIDRNGKIIFDVIYDYAIINKDLNEVALSKNNLYSVYNITGAKIKDNYLWYVPYGEYNVLVKDNKIMIEKDHKVVAEFNGDISDYKIYLDINNNLYIGNSSTTSIIKNNGGIQKYENRELLIDDIDNMVILYQKNNNNYNFYNSNNQLIGTMGITNNNATSVDIQLRKNQYNNNYYDVEAIYSEGNNGGSASDKRTFYSTMLTIDMVNSKLIENKVISGLQLFGKSYYKINVDSVLSIYNSKLDLSLTIKNIIDIKIVDNNHLFAVNNTGHVFLIQIY